MRASHVLALVLGGGGWALPVEGQPRGEPARVCGTLTLTPGAEVPKATWRSSADCRRAAVRVAVVGDTMPYEPFSGGPSTTRVVRVRITVPSPNPTHAPRLVIVRRDSAVAVRRGEVLPRPHRDALHAAFAVAWRDSLEERPAGRGTGVLLEGAVAVTVDTRLQQWRAPVTIEFVERRALPSSGDAGTPSDVGDAALPTGAWHHAHWPVPAVPRTVQLRFLADEPAASQAAMIDRLRPARVVRVSSSVVNVVLPPRVTADSLEDLLRRLDAERGYRLMSGLVPAPGPTSGEAAVSHCLDGCPALPRIAAVLMSGATETDRMRTAAALGGALLEGDEARPWEDDALLVAVADGPAVDSAVRRLRRLPWVVDVETGPRRWRVMPRGAPRETIEARLRERLLTRVAGVRELNRTVGLLEGFAGRRVLGVFEGRDSTRSIRTWVMLADAERDGLFATDRGIALGGTEAFPVRDGDETWIRPAMLDEAARLLPGAPMLRSLGHALREAVAQGELPEPFRIPTAEQIAGAIRPSPRIDTIPTPSFDSVYRRFDVAAAAAALATARQQQDWRMLGRLAWLPDVGAMQGVRRSARQALAPLCRAPLDAAIDDEPSLVAVVEQLGESQALGSLCARRIVFGPEGSPERFEPERRTRRAALQIVSRRPSARLPRLAVALAVADPAQDTLVMRLAASDETRALMSAAVASCRARDGRLPSAVRRALSHHAPPMLLVVVAHLPIDCDRTGVPAAQRRLPSSQGSDDGLSVRPPW